jgi:hypothetical protein
VAGWWFSPDIPVSFANKTEILLKVTGSTITLTLTILLKIKYILNVENMYDGGIS